MKRYLTKRNLYIGLFTILYLLVGLVSLFHSFAFFGLANDSAMSIMLGCCFEIGQVAVLMSLLTSKKDQGRVTNWLLMGMLTIIQILGNVFSSYKYMMLHSTEDLKYFKEPIFVWTDLPDNITTVIVTYLTGALLPIVALAMTSMVSNYIMDTDPDDNKQLSIENGTIENGIIENEVQDEPEDSEGTEQEPQEQENNSVRNEEQEEVDRRMEEESKEDDEEAVDDTDAEEDRQDESRADEAQSQNIDVLKHIEEKEEKTKPHFVNLK